MEPAGSGKRRGGPGEGSTPLGDPAHLGDSAPLALLLLVLLLGESRPLGRGESLLLLRGDPDPLLGDGQLVRTCSLLKSKWTLGP